MADSALGEKLRRALHDALRARDAIAVSALRSALAAIDNAGAVPVGPVPVMGAGSEHFAGTAEGVGAGEAARRRLSDAEIAQIVRAEIADRQAAARAYAEAGQADRADRLLSEARVLTSALDEAGAAR